MQQIKDHLCTSHTVGKGSLYGLFRGTGSLSNFLESKDWARGQHMQHQTHVAYHTSSVVPSITATIHDITDISYKLDS